MPMDSMEASVAGERVRRGEGGRGGREGGKEEREGEGREKGREREENVGKYEKDSRYKCCQQ